MRHTFKINPLVVDLVGLWNKCLLVLLPLVVFYPMLDNGFATGAGDDDWMLYNNAQVYSLRFDNILSYFTSFYQGQYSPINTLAYAVIYYFYGMDPFWYHLFCLALHVANILLVYTFINCLLKLSPSAAAGSKTAHEYQGIALITALLFAIHPMQVESVAWIAASKVVFYSLLFLIALCFYLKYLETRKKRYYVITVILFVVSFGIKEQTVVFPFCLFAIDYYLKRKLITRKVIVEKLPFLVIAAGLGFIEIIAQDTAFSHKLANDYYPLSQRVFLACFSLTEYIFKLVAPVNLSYWYQFPMAPGESLPARYYFYPAVTAALVYYYYRFVLEKKRYLVFGASFFIINLILTLHIVPMARGVVMADRYIYLSCIGVFFIIGQLLTRLLRQTSTSLRFYSYIGAAGMYILLIGQYAYRYADSWT